MTTKNLTKNAKQNLIVTGEYVQMDGETYYRIANSHQMPDFFMSLVGASDHWMFVSSVGALTAGRCDPDSALFPYAADDQISIARAVTGPTTLIRENGNLWEPFSAHESEESIRRNLYKTPLGNKLVFEEVNETRELVFRYRWAFSEKFGFVRSCSLENLGSQSRSLCLLDGIRNVLPYGVASEFMMRFSNLANAYKKNELLSESGLGLYCLSSIPTDRAEPSEGLKATTVWQTGLTPDAILLSSEQLTAFRRGGDLKTEVDIRGKAGAYLVSQVIELELGGSIDWHIVAELEQDHADVVGLNQWLQGATSHDAEVSADIEAGQHDFLRIVSSSDAMQSGANQRRANRHLSNTVFNVMRGGIPLEDYRINADDFRQHVAGFNKTTFEKHRDWFEKLPNSIDMNELREQVSAVGDTDLMRLAFEYLPLAFGRRHGDPTRPWNRFEIRLRGPGGSTNLNYQGNWRDIFQNWEALAQSFPHFTTAMICRFANATTADGYNPYKVTKDGFAWEEPTPDDPWANIGYWGDHQIIYLLKLLEWNRRVDPSELTALVNSPCFVHANVPYRIKNFSHIKQDPQSTIEFDSEASAKIDKRVAAVGADGKLLTDQTDSIHHVTLLEKLLTLSLAKLSNFVPDGGIWLNTQRPEWNDANNALVGNGLSMVTTCYLHRWFRFLSNWLANDESTSFQISAEVGTFFAQVAAILSERLGLLGEKLTPSQRGEVVELLSQAGSDYRDQLYENGLSGKTTDLSREDCLQFFENARQHLESSIRNNRRPDGLYHAYNLLDWRDDGIHVEYLYEMLEGQVAVLSSGLLSAAEVVELLDALRTSPLYRENQHSYLLYPDRQLPRFTEKNQISNETVEASSLLQALISDGNESILRRDVAGGFHFNGRFRNASDLRAALDALPEQFQSVVEKESSDLSRAFEELFAHRQFTGRSGTFFGYEGLGSIYWHMVSKLGLAVVENFFQAVEEGVEDDVVARLRNHFQEIRRGIGGEKKPTEYGAFPSDPYSHTPENAGVKQPGMTGQVKEDVLSRFLELGAHVVDGCLCFRLDLFDRNELVTRPQDFTFHNLRGELETIQVPENGFAFTLCQVPILYQPSDNDSVLVRYANGEQTDIDGNKLDRATTTKLFSRCGQIAAIECHFSALR